MNPDEITAYLCTILPRFGSEPDRSVIKGNFLVLKLVHLIRSGPVDLNRRYFRLMDQLFLKIISHKN